MIDMSLTRITELHVGRGGVPVTGSMVHLLYKICAENGSLLDRTEMHTQQFVFELGQPGTLTHDLISPYVYLMRPGGKRCIVIKTRKKLLLNDGASVVPAGSWLTIVLELLKIRHPQDLRELISD